MPPPLVSSLTYFHAFIPYRRSLPSTAPTLVDGMRSPRWLTSPRYSRMAWASTQWALTWEESNTAAMVLKLAGMQCPAMLCLGTWWPLSCSRWMSRSVIQANFNIFPFKLERIFSLHSKVSKKQNHTELPKTLYKIYQNKNSN